MSGRRSQGQRIRRGATSISERRQAGRIRRNAAACEWLGELEPPTPGQSHRLLLEHVEIRRHTENTIRAIYSGLSMVVKDNLSLNAIYTQPRAPGSFSGVRMLRLYGGRSGRETKKYLAEQDTYTLHKPR